LPPTTSRCSATISPICRSVAMGKRGLRHKRRWPGPAPAAPRADHTWAASTYRVQWLN